MENSEPPLISIICLVVVIILLIFSVIIARTPREVEHYEYKSTQQSVVYQWEAPRLHFQVLGNLTGTIDRLILCESGGDPYAINENDVHYNSDGSVSIGSFGILQFSENTFYEYAPMAGVVSPVLMNPQHQIKTAKYMISIGLANRWTCWDKIN